MNALEEFIEGIVSNAKNMTKEEKEWPLVAILAGDTAVIETVVAQASYDSGIKMVWDFSCGRAGVYSEGDRTKCRSALKIAIPRSDIQDSEI